MVFSFASLRNASLLAPFFRGNVSCGSGKTSQSNFTVVLPVTSRRPGTEAGESGEGRSAVDTAGSNGIHQVERWLLASD